MSDKFVLSRNGTTTETVPQGISNANQIRSIVIIMNDGDVRQCTPLQLQTLLGSNEVIVNLLVTGTAEFQNTTKLAAGTTVVYPLKFQSGTNLTTAQAGVAEYNGTNLFFTRTGTTRQTVVTTNVVATETVVSDTTAIININGVDYKMLLQAIAP